MKGRSVNLEPAIIVSIIGAIVSIFGFIITYRTAKGKNQSDASIAQGDAKSKLDARIDARVTEQLDAAWNKVDELVGKLEERDQEIRELKEHMAASEKRETEMYGYIQELAAHILERKDPPPPTMPVNLVNHFGSK